MITLSEKSIQLFSAMFVEEFKKKTQNFIGSLIEKGLISNHLIHVRKI